MGRERCASMSEGKMLPVPHYLLSMVVSLVMATTLFCSDHQHLSPLVPAKAAGPPLALDLHNPQAAANSQDLRTPKGHLCVYTLLTHPLILV